MKAIIIGAGIAGLAAAKGLQRLGWELYLYEQAPALKPLGAGLVLSANALKALQALGLLEAVLEKGHALHHFSILNKKGKVLANTDHLQLSRGLGIQSCLSIHRADLQQLLLQELMPLPLQLGKRCTSIKQDKNGVQVSFEDGSSDSADLLIGCDGLHSAVRQLVAPKAKKRFAGYTCWRGVTEGQPAAFNFQMATESWGNGHRFGIVPLGNDRIYWFACLNSNTIKNPELIHWGIKELKQQFKDYHAPVEAILQATPAHGLIWNDIEDLQPLRTYVYDKVVLVGDAAHATTPNMGQGACQALESVAVLIAQLAKLPLQQALQAYDKQRVPRAGGIVQQSWQLGKIAQMSHSVGVWLRDQLFPLIPKAINNKQLDTLFNIDFEEVPLLKQRDASRQKSSISAAAGRL